MPTIYLIRHGQNEYVKQGKLPGWLPGIHLNRIGRQQAVQLGQHLRSKKLVAVYSSPLERALETAAEIAAACGLKAAVREALGELRIGSWEGLSLKAARRRKLWPRILNTPSLVRFPGGESFAEGQTRIVTELETLRAKHSHRTAAFACVSHADPIKLAIAHYLGLPLDQFQRLTVAPGSVSMVQIDGAGARLLTLNDTQAFKADGAE
jgi:probable phosphoglycerate mutase